eukprot:CAMPEP_0181254284 /NCGR_PEP_ID=MMETSP1096-20121128/48521_1 /TAXON_ID=156174 ORGANISM="Chrysochromulina ericina, Strain CCMP281" /NCGR_SAMPLE_ID=MMETSP1096 /ASSEMBLY_ACC=CAM_ASM_000453 /LENGTH=35 /DNA_ID= /DNA_START= /DNA_END= /DNA_ORIENTATION=
MRLPLLSPVLYLAVFVDPLSLAQTDGAGYYLKPST